MAAANLQAAPADADPGASAGRQIDATGEATASLTPELVIALCGPIGSPLHSAAEQIANALSEYGYRTEKVRLSEFIRLNAKDGEIDSASEFSKIKSLIRAGDELRHTYDNDILAKLAIAKIGADRRKTFGKFKDIASEANAADGTKIREHRICHVIDSIKNSSELDLLRLVYGDALFAIGIFSPLEVRQRNLEKPGALRPEEVEQLIDTDSGEEFAHGQSVRDTFPRCDFFLRVDHAIDLPDFFGPFQSWRTASVASVEQYRCLNSSGVR
ncbi:cytidine/deoxycytidylate deaminase [Burkholderia pseudomallei]|nr:cytidine/deoxycytidylate deaminase [Burkholderia pseudomallei]